jgi:hypothetical protein
MNHEIDELVSFLKSLWSLIGIGSVSLPFFLPFISLRPDLKTEVLALTVIVVAALCISLSQCGAEDNWIRGKWLPYSLLLIFIVAVVIQQIVSKQLSTVVGRGWQDPAFDQLIVITSLLAYVPIPLFFLILGARAKFARRRVRCTKGHVYESATWVYCPVDGERLS